MYRSASALRDPGNADALFSAPIDGSQAAAKLSDQTYGSGSKVQFFQLSTDGMCAIYQADQDLDESVELFLGKLVPLHLASGSTPPSGSVTRGL